MLVHSKSNFSSDLRRTGLLYEFLSILALNPLESDQQVDSEYMYINQAIEYIKNNYWDGIHIYNIAKYLCIDRSYLYLLFHPQRLFLLKVSVIPAVMVILLHFPKHLSVGNLCLLRNIESRRELLELFLVINFITNLNKSSIYQKKTACYSHAVFPKKE